MSKRHPGSKFHAGIQGRRWQWTRLKIFERDGWRCRACGKVGRLECDHILPLAAGGAPYDPSNLQSLCVGCHIRKTAEDRGGGPDPAREAWRELVAEIANS